REETSEFHEPGLAESPMPKESFCPTARIVSYIVDGHHRYESALMYAKETGVLGKTDVSASKMMFAIANAYDPALFVFPTHRIVQGGNQINADLMEKRY